MKVIIINGPNLNLLGKREPSIYGNESFEAYLSALRSEFSELSIDYYQSNVEGEIIDKIHEVGFSFDYILINAGGYTHTSVAISDAIASVKTPCIEIHISQPSAREEYRHKSLIAGKCMGSISGFGLDSYRLGLASLSS
ncbi:MAG: 3-dehydroquinate dehydratase [Bacteroidota bacterium]|nr:MAG: 3-dehydroquinate dehydratase [Bacteroidota bacterium]